MVSASDSCSTNLLVRRQPPSGSLFPVGTTTVICTARDSAQNRSQCSFTVTVRPCPTLSLSSMSGMVGSTLTVTGQVQRGAPGVRLFWAEIDWPWNAPVAQRKVKCEIQDPYKNLIYSVVKLSEEVLYAPSSQYDFVTWTSGEHLPYASGAKVNSLPTGDNLLTVTPYVGEKPGEGKSYIIRMLDVGRRWSGTWLADPHVSASASDQGLVYKVMKYFTLVLLVLVATIQGAFGFLFSNAPWDYPDGVDRLVYNCATRQPVEDTSWTAQLYRNVDGTWQAISSRCPFGGPAVPGIWLSEEVRIDAPVATTITLQVRVFDGAGILVASSDPCMMTVPNPVPPPPVQTWCLRGIHCPPAPPELDHILKPLATRSRLFSFLTRSETRPVFCLRLSPR